MDHFPEIQLTFAEARVLGCLMEKEVLTPGAYPLTLNSLVTACNQASSRHPVTSLTSTEVDEALRGLSENYLVEKNLGGRAAKYNHCVHDILQMQSSEKAVLTVLLLRGQQTAGEIKQRTERMHNFHSLDEVEETLTWFIEYPHGPLVRRIPVGAGRRAETFVHLLAEDAFDAPESIPEGVLPHPTNGPSQGDSELARWRVEIEERLEALEAELAELRAKQ